MQYLPLDQEARGLFLLCVREDQKDLHPPGKKNYKAIRKNCTQLSCVRISGGSCATSSSANINVKTHLCVITFGPDMDRPGCPGKPCCPGNPRSPWKRKKEKNNDAIFTHSFSFLFLTLVLPMNCKHTWPNRP